MDNGTPRLIVAQECFGVLTNFIKASLKTYFKQKKTSLLSIFMTGLCNELKETKVAEFRLKSCSILFE